MIIITNTIMMMLQMNVINNNSIIISMCVCVFYANTCGLMMLPLLLLLHAPKKQKWIFMLRTCATWQSLTAESKLLQLAEAATRCTLLLLLQLLRRNAADVVVVAVVCWMQHLSAVFVVWLCQKNMCRCTPTFVARCAPPSTAPAPRCCPLHILCMFNDLPPNLLPQIDAGCQLQQWQEQENDVGKWKCE